MNSNSQSRNTVLARNAKIIAGINNRLKTVQAIVLGGVSYTPASLAAQFQSQIDAVNTVIASRGQWTTSIQALDAMMPKVEALAIGLREFVRQLFNNDPQALADFDFAPKKAAVKDPLKQVAAAQKRAATRKARGTTGKKQKLAIKGAVTPAGIGAAVTEALGGSTPPPAGSGSTGAVTPATPPAGPSAAPANPAPNGASATPLANGAPNGATASPPATSSPQHS